MMKFSFSLLQIIRTYFPYEEVQHGNTTKWGAYKAINLKDIDFNADELFTKFENLHRFPLRVSLFRRYPTSIKLEELPEVFRDSYLMKDIGLSRGYSGVDGIMLSNIAKALNFTPVVVLPKEVDFGFKAANGTFVGNFQ